MHLVCDVMKLIERYIYVYIHKYIHAHTIHSVLSQHYESCTSSYPIQYTLLYTKMRSYDLRQPNVVTDGF